PARGGPGSMSGRSGSSVAARTERGDLDVDLAVPAKLPVVLVVLVPEVRGPGHEPGLAAVLPRVEHRLDVVGVQRELGDPVAPVGRLQRVGSLLAVELQLGAPRQTLPRSRPG